MMYMVRMACLKAEEIAALALASPSCQLMICSNNFLEMTSTYLDQLDLMIHSSVSTIVLIMFIYNYTLTIYDTSANGSMRSHSQGRSGRGLFSAFSGFDDMDMGFSSFGNGATFSSFR